MTSASGARALRVLAVGVVLGSGGALVLAGHLAASAEWLAAGVVATLAGAATPAAFYIGRRTERPASYVGSIRGVRPRARASRRGLAEGLALMTLSGVMMAVAGYAGPSERWYLAAPLMFVAGPVVAAAYVLDRAARPRGRTPTGAPRPAGP